MTNPSLNKSVPLTIQQIDTYLNNLNSWQLADDKKMIYREFMTKDFMAAVHLINRITEIAQEENHHPNIHLTDFRKLRVELSTHDANGLSESDFIEAERINDLPVESVNSEELPLEDEPWSGV
jgi:4a-hydroxytetrahydrobiopterin dehydratase